MKTLLALTMFVSAFMEIKEYRFVSQFEKFAENMVENHEKFTNNEWKQQIAEYKEFRIKYKQIKYELSNEQQHNIEKLFHKINAVIIRDKANDIFGSIGEAIEEVTGTLKELSNSSER